MKFDARASLGVWPVDVVVGGSVFRIEPQPALYWILHILDNDFFGMLVDGLSSEDNDRLEESLMYGEITMEDCSRAVREALAAVSGTFWWSAVRLVVAGNQSAMIAGELSLARLDLSTMPFASYIAAVYTICVRNADDKQRKKLDMEIEATPPGVSAEERYDPEVAADQFEAFMASRSN